MAVNLDDPLPLATAARYSFPQDATAVLPVVIGDYISGSHVATDDGDGGLLPTVCIDTTNWVYLLNDLPNAAGPIRIYANDTRQRDDVYTYVRLGDYEGRGHAISYVQFHVNPGSWAISWRGPGACAYPADTLMTNPIDALSSVFGGYGGWTVQDTDWASVMETRRLMNVLGDTMNMVFAEARTYREWLETILPLYHCNMGVDAQGCLRFMLDTSVTTQPTTVLSTLDARRDLAGAEAEPITILRDPADIVTKVTVKARRKWTTGAYTVEVGTSYAPGMSRHGERHRRYDLPGLYTLTQGERWLRGIWMRYGMRADRVVFTVRGLSLMAALPGTFLGMVSPKRHWPTPQLLKVLNCEPNDEDQTITFECFDCQLTVAEAATVPPVAIPFIRSRPIESSPTVDLAPPGPASALVATGSYRRIVLRWTPPGDLDYDHTEIWAAAVNNRASAVFVRNGGYRGTACEETFEVGDSETFYVWLMTVDTTGNGAQGGSGPSGGNWYPLSPTAGIIATSTLVGTGGMAADAITFTYGTVFSGTGGFYAGETIAATSVLGATYLQGDVIAFGNVVVTIGSLHTAILQLRQGSISGTVVGVNYIPNILLAGATTRMDCWGEDFNPFWSGVYVLTIQVVAQDGTQQGFTLFTGSNRLFLRHGKR